MRGFTLIELVTVIGLLTFLGSITAIFGYSLFERYLIQDQVFGVVRNLERGRINALVSYMDSDAIVQIILHPDIIFQKFIGTLPATTTVQISTSSLQRIIIISPDGNISY